MGAAVLVVSALLCLHHVSACISGHGGKPSFGSQLLAVPIGMAKECHGSVTLYEGSEETVVTKDEDIKPSIGVEKVVMEGCGCFTLHTRKGGRGRSFFLGGEGERIMKMRVRSVRRVKCDSYV